MKKSPTKARSKIQLIDDTQSPTAWFAVLEQAKIVGNEDAQQEAIAKLKEMGVTVQFDPNRLSPTAVGELRQKCARLEQRLISETAAMELRSHNLEGRIDAIEKSLASLSKEISLANKCMIRLNEQARNAKPRPLSTKDVKLVRTELRDVAADLCQGHLDSLTQFVNQKCDGITQVRDSFVASLEGRASNLSQKAEDRLARLEYLIANGRTRTKTEEQRGMHPNLDPMTPTSHV